MVEIKDEYFLEILQEIKQETRIRQAKDHIQHGTTTVYEHCVQVAYESYLFAKEKQIDVDLKILVRGELLHESIKLAHDINFLSCFLHGFFHPGIALRNASRDVELNDVEKDIIKKHMFPLTVVPPKYKESWIVCWIDKKCSMRETLKR